MRRTIVLVLLLLVAAGAVYSFLTLVAYPALQANKMALTEASRADLKSDRLRAKKPLRPSFDLVRIEPDGWAVVAGRAETEVKVELLLGATVVGQSTTDADGNFVIVLEEPLLPGHHQLVLRSTAPGDVVVLSVDTAFVSVP